MTCERPINKINGLICAPFTPFHPGGDVNLEPIPAYARYLRENGMNGVFVNGSSGEGLLMTEEERYSTAEAWREQCDDEFKLLVHVGALSVRSARNLAAHAEKIGSAAISVMAPTFPPLATVGQLVQYCEEIAAAAPSTPFYFYHIPGLSRVGLPMAEFIAEAERRIPTFNGMKFTSLDVYEMNQCARHANGRFDILSGADEIMLAALSLVDSKGFIGGTFNYCAPIYVQLLEAFRSGDLARARDLQNKSQDIIDVLCKYKNNMVAGKHMMRLVGLDVGVARTPLAPMAAAEVAAMTEDLRTAGFFEVCNTVEGTRASAPIAPAD